MHTDVSLNLTRNEALVLFEWFANIDAITETACKHESEKKVLWKLQGQLEATLPEPFQSNNKDILSEARKQVDSGAG